MILNDHESQQMNLNILNRFRTVEHFIHDQQEMIRGLRIDKINDFKSPFAKKVELDRAIETYKQEQKEQQAREARLRLSKRGTMVIRSTK